MRYALAVLAVSAAVAHASPVPQGVTAAISPTAAPPSGCTPGFSGTFGIAVMNITTAAAKVRRQATQLADGQPHAGPAVTQISDGQPQAAPAVTQITDGQVQGGMVSQIIDGQIQAPTTHAAISQIGDGQVQAPPVSTAAPLSQISDGQPQAPPASTAAPVSQISDAQPQAPTPKPTSAPPVTEATEGQPAATPVTPTSKASSNSAPTSSSSTAPPAPSSSKPVLVACQTNSTLTLTLADGVLKDGKGRTGYIASNFQFQFDNPPQAGAIFTSGFSVCGSGSLALSGSNIFWQCRSGGFFNLYDRFWAPQCNPVTINALTLQQC